MISFHERKADRKSHYLKRIFGWQLRPCGACSGSGYYDHDGSPPCGACDGTATVSVGGGIGPYTYTWNDPGTQNTATAAGLCAGSYNVLVNDANGCSRSSGITVTDIAAIGIDVAAMDDSCGNGNGTATVTASGGTGAYTYLWDGGQTTQTVVGLSEGTYNVTVTDANGCNVNTDLFSAAIISSTPPISNATATATNITCNGAADGMAIANATTGITPYTYAWSDPGNQTAQTAVGLSTGTYTVTITDVFGCFIDRKSTRLNSSHVVISYAVFCLKNKNTKH